MKSMPSMRPVNDEEEEEDLESPAEADPEAEGAALDMLLVGPAKAEEPTESDPQVLVDEIEDVVAKLRALFPRAS
jgi:hypothetical protein